MAEIVIGLAIVAAVIAVAVWWLFFRKPAPQPLTSRSTRIAAGDATGSGGESARSGDSNSGSAGHDMDPAGDQDQDDQEDEYEEEPELTWQQLVQRADEAKSRGEYDEAIEDYEAALEKAREELGRDSDAVAGILVKQGEAYQCRDDDEDDDETFPPCYPRALAILERRYGPFDERLVPVLRNLISFYDQSDRHPEAETLIRRLEEIERRRQPQLCASPDLAAATDPAPLAIPAPPQAPAPGMELLSEGDGHLARFEYDDAIEAYERALETAREKYGRDAIVAAEIHNRLGCAYQDRDDEDDEPYQDPGAYYRRALAILEQHGGPFDKSLTPVLRNLISYYDQEGEHSKAEGLTRRLEEIERRGTAVGARSSLRHCI